jgi:hypothetical protein
MIDTMKIADYRNFIQRAWVPYGQSLLPDEPIDVNFWDPI